MPSVPITCTRPSTLAGAMDDKSGLMPWAASQALKTVSEHPDLLTRLSLTSGDSWRDFKPLYELSEARGGGKEASAGTNIHMVVNALASGININAVPEPARSDGRAVFDAIEALGMEIIASEIFLVALEGLPEPVAGTADLLLRAPGRGPIFVADTKSVNDAAVHSAAAMRWGIQLFCYASGHPYEGEPVRDSYGRPVIKPELVRTLPSPGLNKTHGLVFTVVRGKAEVETHWVDLAMGETFARTACIVREMRKMGKGALVPAPSWALLEHV